MARVVPQPDPAPRVLIASSDQRLAQYSLGHLAPVLARSTAAAVQLILSRTARLVMIDLDDSAIDAAEVCRTAKETGVSVLVTTDEVKRVPAMLKAGCDGVLLKPYQPNLLASRLGRMLRTLPSRNTASVYSVGGNNGHGTNNSWPDLSCPTCGAGGPVSFDFLSHRRMWYACLACEATWVGARRE